MSAILRDYPSPKGKMCVSPVQWLPGSLSAALPFFSIPDPNSGVLYFRADDPNLYGVNYNSLMVSPVVTKAGVTKQSNKGFNFYSAPWCIPTLPARDLGRRVKITAVDPSITAYITALYGLIGAVSITLTNWRFEQGGYAKCYQILQGSTYVNVGGTTYFGAAKNANTEVSGVASSSLVDSPLITDDFTFNGSTIETWQMPYNTFYVIDTPIVLSAVDSSNPASPRIYFTLQNNVNVLNGPNYH